LTIHIEALMATGELEIFESTSPPWISTDGYSSEATIHAAAIVDDRWLIIVTGPPWGYDDRQTDAAKRCTWYTDLTHKLFDWRSLDGVSIRSPSRTPPSMIDDNTPRAPEHGHRDCGHHMISL
jgi:hypothetical protein